MKHFQLYTLICRNVAKQELDEAEAGKSTGIAILSFISVVTLIFYFFVKNALGVIRVQQQNLIFLKFTLPAKVFAREVVEKVSELEKEKMKTGKAFHDFLPSGVVKDLKKNNVAATQFSCVTIFYGEILDFEDLIKDCSASEVCILKWRNAFKAIFCGF